jgi:hypothetical protein
MVATMRGNSIYAYLGITWLVLKVTHENCKNNYGNVSTQFIGN